MRLRPSSSLLLIAALGLPASGAISAEGGWIYVGTINGVEVRRRALPGTAIEEVMAVATLEGRASEYKSVVTDVPNFPHFMPNVKEARVLSSTPDGVEIAYVRYDLPWPLQPRDYVTRRVVDEDLAPDGSGEYRNRWTELDGRVPPKPGLVRLPKNDGFWHIAQFGPRTVRIEFGCAADPGGALPAWAVNVVSRQTIPDLVEAVHREVLRRRGESAQR